MTNHVHGRPDNQEENLDDLLGRGLGDFAMPSGGRWIGTDIEGCLEIDNSPTHWSDLPTPVRQFEPTDWYASDNDARSPLEADLEDQDGAIS